MGILPEGEQMRRAVKWVSDMRTEHPDAKLFTLIEEACLRFDLSPKDQEVLLHFLTEERARELP